MAQWEITQAGVNSILDAPGSGVRSTLTYTNTYLVDGSFDPAAFKALTTVAAQKQYLEDHAQNGYSSPPFSNNNDDSPLNRQTGGAIANQPAITANENNVNRMTYLYELQEGFGNYYFNLWVVYNSRGESNPETNENMPIFGFFLFDATQSKQETNSIEIYATFVYNAISGSIEIEFSGNELATFLEVSSVDLLPPPAAAPTNTYLITNPSNTEPHGHTPFDNPHLAIQQGNLWGFTAYSNMLGSVSGAANLDPSGQTTTSLTVAIFASSFSDTNKVSKLISSAVASRGQYIIQFTESTYQGVCRVAALSTVNYNASGQTYTLTFEWETPLPTVPDSNVRIYVANEFAYTAENNTDPVELTGEDSIVHLYGKNYWYSSDSTSHTVSLYRESQYNTRDTTFICREDSDFNLTIELTGSVTAVWLNDNSQSINGYDIEPGGAIKLLKVDTDSYVAYRLDDLSTRRVIGGNSIFSSNSGYLNQDITVDYLKPKVALSAAQTHFLNEGYHKTFYLPSNAGSGSVVQFSSPASGSFEGATVTEIFNFSSTEFVQIDLASSSGPNVEMIDYATGTTYTVNSGNPPAVGPGEAVKIYQYEIYRFILTKIFKTPQGLPDNLALVYEGSTINQVDYPIGTQLLVVNNAGTAPVRNSSINIYTSSGKTAEFTNSSVDGDLLLNGTWRARGGYGGNNGFEFFYVQRTD